MGCGAPAGAEVAVIAEANFILHEFTEVFQGDRGITIPGMGVLRFNQYSIGLFRRAGGLCFDDLLILI